MTKPISILGINCVYHESSACLIQDGQLIAVVEEERFNRIKHGKPAQVDNSDELPEQAIAFCLEQGGLNDISQVDFIGYSFEPEHRLRKNNEHQHSYAIPDGDFGTQEVNRSSIKPISMLKRKYVPRVIRGIFSILIITLVMPPVRSMFLATKNLLSW